MNNDSLQPLVDAGFLSKACQFIRRLNSDTNQCWLVRDTHLGVDNLWVVKILRSDDLSVDWRTMIDNTEQAIQEKLTPPIEKLNLHYGWLMMPYREQDDLSCAILSEIEKIRHCAESLCRIHQSNLLFPELNLSQEVQSYLTLINDFKCKQQFLRRMNQLPPLPESGLMINDSERKPCHMDLSFANILSNGEVLDWEFARQAPPLIDVAFCASINQLSESEAKLLFEHYCELRQQQESYLDFLAYLQWSELLNDVWYHLARQ